LDGHDEITTFSLSLCASDGGGTPGINFERIEISVLTATVAFKGRSASLRKYPIDGY
jgi:hypothetical protein